MLSKPMEERRKSCYKKGMVQPLGMATGSLINLAGATASLVLSAQSQTVNPIPFICTSMLTSCLYLSSNVQKAYQVYSTEETEEKESNHFRAKIERERHEKITIVINK